MSARPDEQTPPPLPRVWLPDAAAPADATEWQVMIERIAAASEPGLLRLRDREADVSWPAVLGAWWKPAAVLATAATALLILLDPPVSGGSASGSLPLSVLAAEGDPVSLWRALGIEADPVLALIAIQEQAP